MGRLEIEIRHGHHNGGPAQWGAVVALIVLVVYAGAGNHRTSAMLHEVLSVVEIAAASVVGLAALVITVRVRRAARRRQERIERRAAMAAAAYTYTLSADGTRRPAINGGRVTDWPLPAEWDEIPARDDYRRNS